MGKLRDQGWEYQLEASFIEVYNEQLRDLLADTVPGRREAGKIQGTSGRLGGVCRQHGCARVQGWEGAGSGHWLDCIPHIADLMLCTSFERNCI